MTVRRGNGKDKETIEIAYMHTYAWEGERNRIGETDQRGEGEDHGRSASVFYREWANAKRERKCIVVQREIDRRGGAHKYALGSIHK